TLSPSSSSNTSTPSTISAPLPPFTPRSRSHSPSRSRSPPAREEKEEGAAGDSASGSWWTNFEVGHRPWKEHSGNGSPSRGAGAGDLAVAAKRTKRVPAEQTEGYIHTREVPPATH